MRTINILLFSGLPLFRLDYKFTNLSLQPVAYPGGMHRMHVHPSSPPCASPPPGHVHPPPPPAGKAGYDKRWGSGQQEKNASLFTCDLKIFCRVSLPSKLLTSTATHNFDARQGVPKILKNCRCFMVQEGHPLSKAFKSEILLEMHKKLRWLLLFILFTFPYVGFSLSKLAFKKVF